MFFIDKPYVSDFFENTVRDNAIPIVNTAVARQSGLLKGTLIIDEEQAIAMARESPDLRIYTTSENAIGWLAKHFSFTDLPQKIELFKNKLLFRQLTKSIFSDFYFQEVHIEEFSRLQLHTIPLPCIIKPAVGFFSLGVHKVSTVDEWPGVISTIKAENNQIKDLYPVEVLDTSSYIIEQCIEGEEFAIDAYYNGGGEAVVLSIFSHRFSSDSDVSDRIYTTSKEILENNLGQFTNFTQNIGDLAGVKNFPVHIELRRQDDGTLLPIEVNPMRFGGWCTTADISFHAYGFNPYLFYYQQKKPDWPRALGGKEGRTFSLIVLDNSTGKAGGQIKSFDYQKLLSGFAKPIELRKIDYRIHPLFGFLFVESQGENPTELTTILHSDLNEFVSC